MRNLLSHGRRARPMLCFGFAFTLAIAFAGGLTGRGSSGTHSDTAPVQGGSLTTSSTEAQWPGLDPATNTQDGADNEMMDAIYGALFEFGPHGKIIPDEASGYRIAKGGLTVDISLRHGLVFSDGTPFTAQDVASSITRDLLPANACTCDTNFSAVSSVTSSGPYTVVLHLSRAFSPIIEAFDTEAPNWTVDPTALASMGEKAYAQKPVGAGPFKVVSNVPSEKLVLTRNPRYWKAGRPYLDSLTFLSVANDNSAWAGLETGQLQVIGLSTLPLIKTIDATSGYKVISQPGVFYHFIALNESKPPFNNILAREALYYATDSKALVKGLYDNLYPVVESPTAEADLFYLPSVPGYRTYDPSKAKALVSQLGGLSLTLGTTTNAPSSVSEVEALAAEWSRVGIKATIVINSLQQLIQEQAHNDYEAIDAFYYAESDPAIGLPVYFSSSGSFSPIHDPALDALIDKGSTLLSASARKAVYLQIAEHLSQKAEAPFLYTAPTFVAIKDTVHGISSDQPSIDWENVSVG